MDYSIPPATHRLELSHDPTILVDSEADARVKEQNKKIIEFAENVRLEEDLDRYVFIEVWYNRPDRDERSDTSDSFDALVIDTEEGKIIGTLPPYDSIDPDWKEKR